MNYDIEIAIPVLNEEKDLKRQIKKIKRYIDKKMTSVSVGLIIADNGSTDKTPLIAKELAYQNGIRHITTKKKGVGLALKKAWLSSNSEYVGYIDLDTATDLKHLKEISKIIKFKKYPMLVGSRYLPLSKVKNRKLHREFLSRGFNLFIKILFLSKITDGMIGFKFLRKDKLENLIFNGAKSDGWIFCTEILLVAEFLELEIKEIAVTWEDDQTSKVKIIKLIMEYLKALIILKYNFFLSKFK